MRRPLQGYKQALPILTHWSRQFCTCHNIRAFVACARICSNLITGNGITRKQILHRIRRDMFSAALEEKRCCKYAPGHSIFSRNKAKTMHTNPQTLYIFNPGPLFTKKTPSYWYTIGIPIINLRQSSDHLFKMGIPIPLRLCLVGGPGKTNKQVTLTAAWQR